MRNSLRLLIIVGEAVLVITMAGFALVLIGFKAAQTRVEGQLLGASAVFVPIGACAWWIFPKLQSYYSRSQARAAVIAFAIFTPISFIVAIFLSPISGGYAEMLVGPRFFGLVGAFIGIVAITTFLSFTACALVLWITHRIGPPAETDSP
jgi:hypothetical protein